MPAPASDTPRRSPEYVRLAAGGHINQYPSPVPAERPDPGRFTARNQNKVGISRDRLTGFQHDKLTFFPR